MGSLRRRVYVKQKIAFADDLVSVVLMHYLPFIIVFLMCNNGTDAGIIKLQMVPKNPQCWLQLVHSAVVA